MKKIILTFAAAFVLVGCQSKITGTLEVDDAPFAARQCRSGEAFGFYGIELTDTANRRLRIYPNADGTCAVALFKGDAATGDAIKRCGSLTIEKQSSRINSIHNVRGTAQLACEAGSHKITGNVEFENCH